MESEAKLMISLGTGLFAGWLAKELTKNYGAKKSKKIGTIVGCLATAAMLKQAFSKREERAARGNDLWFHIGKNMGEEKSRHLTKLSAYKSGISWEKSDDIFDYEFLMVKRFAQDIVNSGTEAGKRFSYLQASKKHSVIIKVSKTGNTETDTENWKNACDGNGTVAIVNINIMDTKLYEDGVRKDLRASLAHEVAGHAYNFCRGISTYRGDGTGTWQGLCVEEQTATAMENEIRDYYLLPQRKKYKGVWDVPIFDRKTDSWYLLPGEFDANGGYRTLQGDAERWYPK